MSKYTELITNYHRGKQLFVDHVDLSTRPFTDAITSIQSLINKFDVDTAIGSQLDVIGDWVGRSRVVNSPISGVYFSFDVDSLGWDAGVWQGPYDPDAGFTSLSDDTYRVIIKAKIAINNWDGTNETLPGILDTALDGSGISMQIIDNQDMTISIWVFPDNDIGQVSLELLAAIRQGYLTIKAAGVWAGSIQTPSITTPSAGSKFFGFDLDNKYIAGFDDGAWEKDL